MKHKALIVGVGALIVIYFAIQFFGADVSGDNNDLSDLTTDDLTDDFSDDGGDVQATSGATPTLISAWATIINKVESGGNPNALSARNNNPGNLVLNGTYAKFDTLAEGWAALYNDLAAKLRKYPGYTIQQIMERYAPAADGTALNAGNNPTAYAQSVANYLSGIFGQNISTSTTLSQLQQLTA